MNGRVHGCLHSTRVGVCVTGWGWGILYSEPLLGFPGPGRRVRVCSRQIYALLGAEAAFAE